MIDFEKVRPVMHGRFSFVGLKQEEGVTCFYLPKGFSTKLPPTDLRRIFFALYKALRCFATEAERRGGSWAKDIFQHAPDRDGTLPLHRDAPADHGDWQSLFGYTPLARFDRLLDDFDETSVFNLVRRQNRAEEPDWSRMDEVLLRATFLPNGAMMVDDPVRASGTMQRTTPPMVALYCYIYTEVMLAMGNGATLRPEMKALAEQLREQEALTEGALFGIGVAEQTRDRLCDLFERCEASTYYKDDDHARFSEACGMFLFGPADSGSGGNVIWGMDTFWPVWEALAVARALIHPENGEPLYLDPLLAIPLPINTLDMTIKVGAQNSTTLRPDCVIRYPFNPTIQLQNPNPTWNDHGWKLQFELTHEGRNLKARIAPVSSRSLDVQTILAPGSARGMPFSMNVREIDQAQVISLIGPVESDPLATPDYFLMCEIFNDVFLDGWKKRVPPADFHRHLLTLCGSPVDPAFPWALVRCDFEKEMTSQSCLPKRYASRLAFLDRHKDKIAAAARTCGGSLMILDAKYKEKADLQAGVDFSRTMQDDVRKQMVYEWAMARQGQQGSIRSEFLLPGMADAAPLHEKAPSIWGHISLRTVDLVKAADDYANILKLMRQEGPGTEIPSL